MGAISPDKKKYDDLAVEFFKTLGAEAYPVNKTGRYIDVIAVKGNVLALVEVKSASETSADPNFDDTTGLSMGLSLRHGSYLKTARKQAMALFDERGKSIERLYAAAIAAQLYRYYYEFDTLIEKYEDALGGRIKLSGKRFTKEPYLAIPHEHERAAEAVVKALRANSFIRSYDARSARDITLIKVVFP